MPRSASTEDVLGTDGTISRGQQIRYAPQKVNRPDGNRDSSARREACPPVTCKTSSSRIRGNATPNCPFELGFRVSIACRMAVESYRQGRAVSWDAQKEQIT